MTELSLLARIFAMILFKLPIRLIGRKYLTVFALWVFGIKAMKEELHPLGNVPEEKNSMTTTEISFSRNFQYLRKNSNAKPSGPGDLFVRKSHTALLISSIETVRSRSSSPTKAD
nr:hypothetical protein [Tanacetum cinerariifolium]